MRQNCTKNVWFGSFFSLPFQRSYRYDVRDARNLRLLLGFIEERKENAAMDSTLQNIIEIALQQGIWAGLYIYLFFRMLKQNEEREAQYQSTIDKLSGNIPEKGSVLSVVYDNVDNLSETLELEYITELEKSVNISINLVNTPITEAEVLM